MSNKAYILLYEFMKDKLNKKFIKPFNYQEDEIKLVLFKNNNKISELSENDLKEYLTNINLGMFSFFRHGDCSLYKFYTTKLKNEERPKFLRLLDSLSINTMFLNNTLRNIVIQQEDINKKIAVIADTIGEGKYKTATEIGSLIDNIFMDEKLKEAILELLNEQLTYIKDVKFIKYIIDECKNKFDGIISIIDLIMLINPKIKIKYNESLYKICSQFIDNIKNESCYMTQIVDQINDSYKDKNNTRAEFKPNYEIEKIQQEHLTSKPPLEELNYLDSYFNLTNRTKVKYNYIQFKRHIIFLLLKGRNILTNIKITNSFKNLNTELKESIVIDNSVNVEGLKNYVSKFLLVLTEGETDKIPELIDYCKEHKDQIIELLSKNKDAIINVLLESFSRAGIKRGKEIYTEITTALNIDVKGIMNDVINNLDSNKELETKVITSMKFLSKFIKYLNTQIKLVKTKIQT